MNTQRQHQLLHRIEEQKAESQLRQDSVVALRQEQAAEAQQIRARFETEQRQTLLKLSQFIWLSFGVLEGLIGLRIILKLIAANPNNPFAEFTYAVTNLFLWPFAGLTATPAANGIVLEISSIIALFFYALLSVFIQRLIWIAFGRPKV